jgi:hypothetical protein
MFYPAGWIAAIDVTDFKKALSRSILLIYLHFFLKRENHYSFFTLTIRKTLLMKKLVFILFFIFALAQVQAQEPVYADNVYTTVRTFYEDGTLASEINYVNNKPVGEYMFFYPDGTLMEEGVWNEKHLTGNFKRYYANGQIAQEFYYDEQGQRIGRQKYFYKSGSLQAEKQMGPPEHVIVRYTTDGKEKIYVSF